MTFSSLYSLSCKTPRPENLRAWPLGLGEEEEQMQGAESRFNLRRCPATPRRVCVCRLNSAVLFPLVQQQIGHLSISQHTFSPVFFFCSILKKKKKGNLASIHGCSLMVFNQDPGGHLNPLHWWAISNNALLAMVVHVALCKRMGTFAR